MLLLSLFIGIAITYHILLYFIVRMKIYSIVMIIILPRYKPLEGAEEKRWTEINSIPSDLTEYILKDMTPGQQFIIQVIDDK